MHKVGNVEGDIPCLDVVPATAVSTDLTEVADEKKTAEDIA